MDNATAPSRIIGTENFLFLRERAGVISVKRRNCVRFPDASGPYHKLLGFTMHRTSWTPSPMTRDKETRSQTTRASPADLINPTRCTLDREVVGVDRQALSGTPVPQRNSKT